MWKVKEISLSPQSWVTVSQRLCWTQATPWFWCSLYPSPAKQSYIDFSCLHLYRQGEIFLLPFLLLYELLLFTWRFCLLLQVWNYLLLLGICALFKKRALFFLLWIKCWDDRRSFQYGLVKYLLFLLFSVQDFGPLFSLNVTMLSSACVCHFICTLVQNQVCSGFKL